MKLSRPFYYFTLFIVTLFPLHHCFLGESNLLQNGHISRYKRQTNQNVKVFVVPRELQNPGGQLFTLAKNLKAEPGVTYRFENGSAPQNLSIDQNSGIVSKVNEFSRDQTKINFGVEVLVNAKVDFLISVTMNIISRPMDDPIFNNEPVPMWAVIPVWIRPGTIIYSVRALDTNYGATDIVYSLESGGEGKFAVDPSTGDVSIVGRQQFELNRVYTLLISAQSQGMRLPSGKVGYSQTLNVKVGTKEPQFFRTPYNISFYENATANSIIGYVKAKSFQDLPLTYSMTPTDENFFLDAQTGAVRLNRQMTWALDLRQYFFNVTVTEQYSSFVTTTAFVITLLSINHAPVFPAPHYTMYKVPESFAVGTELLKMVVRDYDPGALGTLTFESTSDTFAASLTPDGLVSLKLARPLDYESVVNGKYEFNIFAKDGGSPSLTGTATVQIWVQNENNKAPVMEPANQRITIREGAGPDLLLFYIQAYDPDGDNITFTYTEAPLNAGFFTVDSTSGAVTLTKAIVAGQNISSFNLSISLRDDGSCCPSSPPGTPHETRGNVEVNIYRVNTQPTFQGCRNYAPKVTEDQIVVDPTSILNMTALDTDVGPNGDLAFQIFGDENTFFKVVKSGSRTANLQIKGSVNRETKNILKFNDTFKLPVTVSVRDMGIPTLTSYCLVFVTIETVNKYAPTFDYGQRTNYVYSNDLTANQKLARVFAFDRDFGPNGEVVYSMSSTSSDPACSDLTVEEQTGFILWKGTSPNPSVLKTINCNFIASDKGTPSLTSMVPVTFIFTNDVTLKPPTWQNLNGLAIDDTSVTMLENASTSTVVATLSAYSSNNNQLVSFFISDESLEVLNGDSNFVANQTTTGSSASMDVQVKKLLPEANLRPQYFLRCRAFVTATDGTLVTNVARLRVNVRDVNNQVPQFLGRDSNGIYTAAVTQYSRNGDYVVTVTSVDMDKDWPNNKVTYSFQDASDSFSISESNGEIVVRSSKTTQIFDPDVKSVYELIVVATDGAPSSINGPLPNRASVRVQVIVSGGILGNPYFQGNFSATLNEGIPRFTNVLDAKATVPTNPSGGISSIVRYNIQQGNTFRNFAVDPDTGGIYNVRPILRSMAQSYQLTYAVFNGLKNNISYVSITVNAANIFPPTFSMSNYVYSGQPITEKDASSVGTRVATVSATSQSGNPVTYTSSNPSNFAVSPTGDVTLVQGLSRDSPDGFAPQQVNIIANDGLNPPSYAVVTLNLTDINDHKPLFDTCCTAGYVGENGANGATVMQLKAWDADFGPNGTVEYSIVDDPSGNFYVSPAGVVSANRPLNFEDKQKYSIRVKGTDKGVAKLSSETNVDIYVTDVSESPPSFPQPSYTTTAPEELPLSSTVLSVRAVDADPMDRLVYSLMNQGTTDDAKFFYVETLQAFNGSYETSTAQRVATAVIKIAARIDYDVNKKSNYTFQLLVKDSANQEARTSVTVRITDINDNPPVFNVEQMNATLNENVSLGTKVATFTASDIDSGLNGQFTYSIDYENSDPMFMFQVDPTSGDVTVRSQLDYERMPKMEVKVLAIDRGTPPLTGTATLTITVENADDSAPVLRTLLPSDPLPINTISPNGTRIKCLDVSDPDNNNNINNNNYNFQIDCTGLFSERCSDLAVDSGGCIITNRNNFANLPYNSYIVPVKITKKSGSQKSVTEIVGLTIQNLTHGQPTGAEKKVKVMNYVGANGGFSAIPLGSVYAFDSEPDQMQYSIDPASPYFYLNGSKGQIWLRGNATPGEQVANVKVTNNKFPTQPTDSKVKANLMFVNESALKAATSLRLIGLRDARDLLQWTSDRSTTVLDLLAQKISAVVEPGSIVEILSIWNTTLPWVDVLYAVHGSPYYSPEKVAALVWMARNDIFQSTKLSISMSPVDLCKSEFYSCWDQGCTTQLTVSENEPRLVDSGENSFVGIRAMFHQVCECRSGRSDVSDASVATRCVSDSCLNGGTCMLNNSVVTCICPTGFEGRRCQKTKVSLRDGYLLLPPLTSCEVSHVTFEFLAASDSPANALLLYNGPISEPSPGLGTYEEVSSPTYQPRDFLLLELTNGKPRLRIDLGDGEVKLDFETSTLASLNDGKWHSIDIIHNGKEIRLIVDKCGKATLSENITSSTMDTSTCEIKATAPLQRFLLNTVSPLQLGGRWDASTQYPLGWQKAGFRGCFKNVQHNGETYDLSVGSWRQSSNAQDSCPNDLCGSCPASATCLPNVILGTPICQCPPGFRGAACDIPTTVKYFDATGFAQWEMTNEFQTAYNSSYLQSFWFSDRLELSFRTRQTDGVLFKAQSFTGLERYLLEVKNSTLSFAYDLGSGDIVLTLPNVNISDGAWHRVLVVRYGNMAEMHLDSGGSRRHNASLPTNDHRLLKIKSASALGDATFNVWMNRLVASKNLGKSCITDVRYGGYWWPLSDPENSEARVTSRVSLVGSSDTGCSVGACTMQCPANMVCVDLWQATQCICKNYTSPFLAPPTDQCLAKSCLTSPCLNGGTCVMMDNLVTCVCPPPWTGPVCDGTGPKPDESIQGGRNFNLVAAIVLPIIFGLLLLLLLALLIWFCCCRKRRDGLLYDEPEKDIRENVISYDDEGAGEEDNYAFDLLQLQKSSPYGTDVMSSNNNVVGPPVFASRAGAGRPLPGDYPSIADFIADRLNDIDNNPGTIMDDSRANFTFEGRGSPTGSLSSLASDDGEDRDANFDWLEGMGPRFGRLADLYGDSGQV